MKTFDAIVIGAGPGGYPCAIRLAQEGKKVAIVEKDKWGGVCLNVGCIPSKALIHASSQFNKLKHLDEMGIQTSAPKLDMEKMQVWKGGVVKQLTQGVSGLLKMNGVTAVSGNAVFKDAHTLEITGSSGKETITAKDIVIATGSRVVEIPILKFNGKNVLDSTQALDLKKLPKKFLVIGK
jgi:dihydrolipoamide dehydrogenase